MSKCAAVLVHECQLEEGHEYSHQRGQLLWEGTDTRIAELEADNAELTALFDMQYRRDVEFVRRLRAEGKVPPMVSPDYGNMLTMMSLKLEELVRWRRRYTTATPTEIRPGQTNAYIMHTGPAPREVTSRSHYDVEPCSMTYPDGTTECAWLAANPEPIG